MPKNNECSGTCTGSATMTQVIKVGRCENVGKNPPPKLVIDTYEAAIKKARKDCQKGCECVVRQKATKIKNTCENLSARTGHEWTCTVTVFGSCK